MMFNHRYNTKQEALESANKLAREGGWEFLPCDTPERGLNGIVAFKGSGDLEKMERFEWPVFAKELIPDMNNDVSPKELAKFIIEENVHECDDPIRRLIGFVKYIPAENRSIVRRVRIVQLKDTPEADAIKQFWSNIREESENIRKLRTLECAAIKGSP